MPDRIPELDVLVSVAKEVPMMPADEIRRRGTRRRTARLAGITAGSLALLAVAGFGIWNSPLADGLRSPQWANTAVPSPEPTETPSETPVPSPTPTPTQTPTIPDPGPVAPTWDNLPTGAMLTEKGVEPPLAVLAQHEGPGDVPLGACQPTDWGAPATFLVQGYGEASMSWGPYYWAAVLGYDSAADADAGFSALHEAAADCGARLVEAGWRDPRTEDLSGSLPPVENTDADPVLMSFFGTVALPGDPDNDPGIFSDTLIVQAGERVLWVTQSFEGWDHNCVLNEDVDLPQCAMGAGLQDMYDALVK